MMDFQAGDANLRDPLEALAGSLLSKKWSMLRGIRNASSNWVGKTIMSIVMGVLILSFAVWGIADIFRGLRPVDRSPRSATPKSRTEQFRQTYNDRLQQIGRQFGRPLTQDQARGLRHRPPGAAAGDRGSRARRGRAPARARPVRRRDHADDPDRSEFQGHQRRIRSEPLPAGDPPVRLHRAALHRRAAQGRAAAADRRHRHRRPRAVERRCCRRSASSRTSSARSTI